MAKSGQITVTTAGTAVQGPDKDTATGSVFRLKAHPDNTDAVWVGEVSGDVTSSNGYPLKPGEDIVISGLSLAKYWFDANVNGEKICWLLIM